MTKLNFCPLEEEDRPKRCRKCPIPLRERYDRCKWFKGYTERFGPPPYNREWNPDKKRRIPGEIY